MKIGIIIFDGFTDLDFYLAWDLLNRVRLLNLSKNWKVEILGDKEEFISATGLSIRTTRPYDFANECDALFFCSGPKTRELIKNERFLNNFKLDESLQVIAAIDSGALILAALGLLNGKTATTYPTTVDLLQSFGVQVEESSFVSTGNIATGARCLAGDKLALWIIEKLVGTEISHKIYDSVKPLMNNEQEKL